MNRCSCWSARRSCVKTVMTLQHSPEVSCAEHTKLANIAQQVHHTIEQFQVGHDHS